MKIKKLFTSPTFPYDMVLKTINGEYKKFSSAPFREIKEEDLTPVPYYQEKGNNAKEAEDYIYKCYKLEKE